MPFKSKAQIAWAAEQVRLGKWTKERFDEWMSETPKHLPERVGKPFKGSKPMKPKVVK